jgi:histidinol-phosphate/aromatic aminotransferase/cobyric acid decarboxylase-like protein
VKWGGVAALKDAAAQDEVRKKTLQLRKKTAAELESYGYNVIPSETNFFMVHLRREVWPIIQEFSQRGILVGRPFPPMLEYL